MYKDLKTNEETKKGNETMGAETIQNKRVSLKSQKSKINKMFGILVVLIGFGFSVMAQDVIVLKDGTEINALVQEIDVEYVKYKKFDNQSGPVYTKAIAEIFMIKYQNGSKDVFNQTTKPVEKTVEQPKQVVNSKEPAANSKQISQEEECTIASCGLLIACSDAPRMMTWDEAKQNTPVGYRLPTIQQLKCMRSLRTEGRLFSREYWSCEEDGRKAYSVTMDDGEDEKNSKNDKHHVRYVKYLKYEMKDNTSQKIQTESVQDISPSQTISNSESLNNQSFVLSKKAEIIIDSYGFLDGAALCNLIIMKFEKLGFCCMHREELKNNTTASITIVVHNAGPSTFRVHINDRRQNNLEVFDEKYTNWVGIRKTVDNFISDIMPFIGE